MRGSKHLQLPPSWHPLQSDARGTAQVFLRQMLWRNTLSQSGKIPSVDMEKYSQLIWRNAKHIHQHSRRLPVDHQISRTEILKSDSEKYIQSLRTNTVVNISEIRDMSEINIFITSSRRLPVEPQPDPPDLHPLLSFHQHTLCQ